MNEIIHIQAGQCGNQAGSMFWNEISQEHGLTYNGQYIGNDPNELDRIGVYYSVNEGQRYVPRCVLFDLEPDALETVKCGPWGKLFRPDNYVYGLDGSGNNWARGFYGTRGVADVVFDTLRKEAETCDCLQGIQLIHSLGGGTGSGTGCFLLERMREYFPDRLLAAYSVAPCAKVSDTVVEPYNSILSLSQFTHLTYQTMLLDNEAMYNICFRTLKIPMPSYQHLNHLIANTMAGVTTSLRFRGVLNADLRKLAVNMIPFPRLHFFVAGYSPISPSAGRYETLSLQSLSREIFSGRNNIMADCDPRNGRYLTVSAIFRGQVSAHQVERQMARLRDKNDPLFVEWIPNNLKSTVCHVMRPNVSLSAAFMLNTTAVQEIFRRLLRQFSVMFRRRAFLHWYQNEGMEEAEFRVAETAITDLISEYEQYQDERADISPYNSSDDDDEID